jgi:hypothetical protein
MSMTHLATDFLFLAFSLLYERAHARSGTTTAVASIQPKDWIRSHPIKTTQDHHSIKHMPNNHPSPPGT